MRVAVTGTPGTGKTTATALLGSEVPLDPPLSVVHLNDAIREHNLTTGVDADRDSLVADLDAVAAYLEEREAAEDGTGEPTGGGDAGLLVESHLAHRLAADRVVVLRAHPETLAGRLRERGEADASVRENAESEALDVVLGEAVERHGTDAVYEIDTTDRDPAAVAQAIAAVVASERDPAVGTVDFSDYLTDPANLATEGVGAGVDAPGATGDGPADGGDGEP